MIADTNIGKISPPVKLHISIMNEATGVAFVSAINGEKITFRKAETEARLDVVTPINIPNRSPFNIRNNVESVIR